MAGALVVAAALLLARRQLAIRWHRVFGEPADADRVRGDLGETLAHAAVRDLDRQSPELDLGIYPGRRVRGTEIDLLVVTRSAVWVVECKAWRGRLAAGADRWVSWSTPRRGAPVQQRRRDPVRQAQAQARALSDQFTDAGLTAVPVRELVVFTDPDVDLDGVRDAGFVLYLDELPEFFRIGPGREGPPLESASRDQVCRLIERTPAWDFLELEGGGRRGRLVTAQMDISTAGGRRSMELRGVREAEFQLRGWPVQRVSARLTLDGETVEGTAVNPVDRLWLKEADGRVHPYPLCVLRGFVRGHE